MGKLWCVSVDDAVRQLERQARFEELTERLRPWLQFRDYAAAETIVARGERQEGTQLLIGGRAEVRGEHGGARIAEYGPGDALEPQAAFEDHVAGVDVAAKEPCRTVLMTASARQSLERDDLVLAHELSKHLIGVMLARQTRLSG